MVLGNVKVGQIRPPSTTGTRPVSRLPTTATPVAKNNELAATNTKVEVKKIPSGSKMVSTTTKPGQVVKVSVETIKKNVTPTQSVTTVKTTIHKRTVVPNTKPNVRKPVIATPGVSKPLNATSGASRASKTTRNGTTPLAAEKSTKTSLTAIPPRSTINKVLLGTVAKKTNPLRSSKTSSSPPVSSPLSKTKTPVTRAPPTDPNMEQCSICSRSFTNDRIDKHKEICAKTSVKKRKTFDVTKMRVKGTEAEEYIKRGVHKKETPKPKTTSWRTKHEEFIRSIKDAKMVQKHLESGGKLSDLPPPKPSENADYVSCPHCNRRFNPSAADRHIPKCKNIVSNKKSITPNKNK